MQLCRKNFLMQGEVANEDWIRSTFGAIPNRKMGDRFPPPRIFRFSLEGAEEDTRALHFPFLLHFVSPLLYP